ncbi:HPr family phosphocarrier protein [Paenibacillus cremeus]|uniref:HPr family phosphocarrier protein n=1 Tax=Paenibacillus cremeus TaxID=2163881 RepID=A0A559KEK6_9BACL|nr:HPr family phosphocarrier protein [Paenibacillus cremeus]TVY10560.1 HPr family phosphocarrier protein [Paenibacillus cremeus]
MRVHEITITSDMQPQYLQLIAQRASEFRSDIKIKFEKENIQLDAKSILGMMMLPMHRGTKVIIQTKGGDEEEAIETMSSLLELKA